jgi:hypothetical protein
MLPLKTDFFPFLSSPSLATQLPLLSFVVVSSPPSSRCHQNFPSFRHFSVTLPLPFRCASLFLGQRMASIVHVRLNPLTSSRFHSLADSHLFPSFPSSPLRGPSPLSLFALSRIVEQQEQLRRRLSLSVTEEEVKRALFLSVCKMDARNEQRDDRPSSHAALTRSTSLSLSLPLLLALPSFKRFSKQAT